MSKSKEGMKVPKKGDVRLTIEGRPEDLRKFVGEGKKGSKKAPKVRVVER